MDDGQAALVSGANRGIGREIVRQLDESGVATILGSRAEEKRRTTAEGMDGDVRVRQLDATDEMGAARLARDVEEEFGWLDVLANDAVIDRGQQGVDAATSTWQGRRWR